MNKDVSIVIQTKNRPKSLERLLFSLFSSLKEPIYIYIWDGGRGVENVLEIVRAVDILSTQGHKVFFIDCEGLTLAEARHLALASPRLDTTPYIYICWMMMLS